jgi:hypothetical protein
VSFLSFFLSGFFFFLLSFEVHVLFTRVVVRSQFSLLTVNTQLVCQLRTQEIEDSRDVEFFMVGNDAAAVQKRLDNIRRKAPKFVCLNDDMNKTHTPKGVLRALHGFSRSLLPTPSPFELRGGKVNEKLHVDDAYLRRTAHLSPHSSTLRSTFLWSLAAVVVVVAAVYAIRTARLARVSHACADECARVLPTLWSSSSLSPSSSSSSSATSMHGVDSDSDGVGQKRS